MTYLLPNGSKLAINPKTIKALEKKFDIELNDLYQKALNDQQILESLVYYIAYLYAESGNVTYLNELQALTKEQKKQFWEQSRRYRRDVLNNCQTKTLSSNQWENVPDTNREE